MGRLDEVLQEAIALGDEERWEEMAQVLVEGLEDSPDDPYMLCWLGVAQQELGNDGVAYEYFRRCLAQDPMDPHLLALAGSGLAAFDDPEAEVALRTAALSAPDLPMARLQYGAYLARAGMFQEALEHLEAAVGLADDDPTVHSELGNALALKGDIPRAIASMEQALALAPDDSWTRTLLGLLQVESGALEEGAEALVRSAEEHAEDLEAQVLAALAAAAVGWEEAAQAALTRATEYAQSGDKVLLDEAEQRIDAGKDAAREMLVESIGPSSLRERLMEPL